MSRHKSDVYLVVHVCLDQATALSEFPSLCAGNLSTPQASGIGTNATASAKQAPRAIILSGRSTDEECEEIKAAVASKAPGVRIIRITRDDLAAAGIPVPPPGQLPPTGPPPPGFVHPNREAITKVVKEKLQGI